MERLSLPLCQFRIPEISVCPAWLVAPVREGPAPACRSCWWPGFRLRSRHSSPTGNWGIHLLAAAVVFLQTSPSPERQGTPAMLASLDIFKMEKGTYVWKAAVESFELAKSKVQELATNAPGEYMIFSQTTGSKIVVNPNGLPEPGARHDSQ
jgi:hypothetical protein